jgi:aerobic-type carbon monoxide dehydrogenase small subunit (CoxS/CutS family)
MDERQSIRLVVNGKTVTATVEPRMHLIDFLRDELQIKGARAGCEHGVCGACTIRLNDQMVRGCLVLAVCAANCTVETIEGASDRGDLAEL